MNIKIAALHFKADKKLEELINEKISKLEKFSDQIINAEVTLKVENTDKPINKIVDVRLIIKGNDLIASKLSNTFESALDHTIEALRKQLTKNKEIVKGL